MITGILAGMAWAAQTVLLGLVLSAAPMTASAEAMRLAPFAGTFLHDLSSALIMLLYLALRGRLRDFAAVFRSPDFKWLLLASAIGGPVGMTGYVLAVNQLGSAIGAVASAVYPAIGALLACLFLHERMRAHQWLFLLITLLGVYGLGGGGGIAAGNFWLGMVGALLCALGWGTEAVILAKCLRGGIGNEYALAVRQTVSALLYGTVLLPAFGGWPFTAGLITGGTGLLLPTAAAAALFASLSYCLYYKAIASLGAAKAMALNITYTAWAIVFTFLLYRDFALLSPRILLSGAAVVIGGILAAAEEGTGRLFRRHRKEGSA